MLGLIKHLGASVFRVRSHCLKEITYREKQWGNISHFGATTFQICATSGLREDGWVPLKAPTRPHLTFVITCRVQHTWRLMDQEEMPLPWPLSTFLPNNTLFPPRPFLNCHVWLTQSAATQMGGFTHPLKSPAVSSYIIAEPCRVCRTALWACHRMWLRLRLSGGWEATVKGVPTWSPADTEEQTQPEVLEDPLMWLGTNMLPFSCRVLVLMRRVFYSTCERKSSSAGRCRPQPRSISAYEISSSIMNSPKRKKGQHGAMK